MYSVNFTVTRKMFTLSLHFNGTNSYLFANGKDIVKFKANNSKIVAAPLCWGNISKDWSVDHLKRTGLNGYVYEFSVDYDSFNNPVDINKIIPTSHNYFMSKYDIK